MTRPVAGRAESGIEDPVPAGDPPDPPDPARDDPADDGGDPEYVLAAPGRGRRALVALLVLVLAGCLLVAGGAISIATGIGQPYRPGTDSVDAGFARDMITHHEQAVQMAEVIRDHGTDPKLRLIAYDVETQQIGQVGQMRGWLDSWSLSEASPAEHMAWMGADAPAHQHDATDAAGAVMPGMATTAEMDRLTAMAGTPAADVYFLQLMIRHHQGGLPMAQYAAGHAHLDYVSNLASKIAAAQSSEVVTMEQLLRARGGVPLPER